MVAIKTRKRHAKFPAHAQTILNRCVFHANPSRPQRMKLIATWSNGSAMMEHGVKLYSG